MTTLEIEIDGWVGICVLGWAFCAAVVFVCAPDGRSELKSRTSSKMLFVMTAKLYHKIVVPSSARHGGVHTAVVLGKMAINCQPVAA
jgi:hypothetical protein